MNSYYQPNMAGERIVKDGLSGRAAYESVLNSESRPQQGRSEGTGFWLISIIVVILSALFSIFAAPKSEATDAAEAGHDDNRN